MSNDRNTLFVNMNNVSGKQVMFLFKSVHPTASGMSVTNGIQKE